MALRDEGPIRRIRVRMLMAEVGIFSWAELARRIRKNHPEVAVTPQALSRVLAGYRPHTNVHLLRAVAHVLHASVDELIEAVWGDEDDGGTLTRDRSKASQLSRYNRSAA